MTYPESPTPKISPTVVTLAGRRPDAEDADKIRFPSTNADMVRQRLHELFQREAYKTLISSAACGTDLLAIGVALQLGMQTFIVLPFAPEVFRRLSVTDRPGDWGEPFDEVIGQAKQAGTLRILNYAEENTEAFLKTNEQMVALAQSQVQANITPVCVLVWDGQPKGEDDATQQFGHLCREAGFPVIEVSTL